MTESPALTMITGAQIAAYGFPDGHPFGVDRHAAFLAEYSGSTAVDRVRQLEPVEAARDVIEYFHTPRYVDRVQTASKTGAGYLDGGDTPAFVGVYEAAAHVVGATLLALQSVIRTDIPRAFVPIAGLHHAARDSAAGFCVFNDCGIAIESARRDYGLQRIAYVDIDAHHGDGVFYAFEDDPDIGFADIHEDGRFLYPGTGTREETGRGRAAGTKLNIPVPPGADDDVFMTAWQEVENYVHAFKPELILLQCGADSLGGDPLTHLAFTAAAHEHAAARLRVLADEYCEGRLIGLGGGGYDRGNLARAWTRVVEALV